MANKKRDADPWWTKAAVAAEELQKGWTVRAGDAGKVGVMGRECLGDGCYVWGFGLRVCYGGGIWGRGGGKGAGERVCGEVICFMGNVGLWGVGFWGMWGCGGRMWLWGMWLWGRGVRVAMGKEGTCGYGLGREYSCMRAQFVLCIGVSILGPDKSRGPVGRTVGRTNPGEQIRMGAMEVR